MINGIEILSSTEVVAESAFNETAAWIAFSILFVIIIALCIFSWVNEGFSSVIIGVVIIGFITSYVIGMIAGDTFSTPTAYKTQYKVTIGKTVSMTEFCERYEIIEQEGKIFTIEEKN